MKRRLLRALLLLGLTAGGSTQAVADGFTCLTVTINGEKVNYNVSDIKKIVFDAENMFLNLENEEVVTLPFTTLTNMTIGDITGISVVGNDSGLELNDGTLTVNMQTDGSVLLYDSAGKTLKKIQVKPGRNTIDLGQLPKGVYIVKVNGTAKKVMNQ